MFMFMFMLVFTGIVTIASASLGERRMVELRQSCARAAPELRQTILRATQSSARAARAFNLAFNLAFRLFRLFRLPPQLPPGERREPRTQPRTQPRTANFGLLPFDRSNDPLRARLDTLIRARSEPAPSQARIFAAAPRNPRRRHSAAPALELIIRKYHQMIFSYYYLRPRGNSQES